MNKLWDSQVWGGAGRSDILHYLLFFNVGDGRIDTISEAEYRWKPNLSVAQKKACLDAIDKVKCQVASHGLLITEALHDKLNDASKALRCPFFEVQVPYGTPRSVDHSWQSVAIGELLQKNTLVHDIFADTELSVNIT